MDTVLLQEAIRRIDAANADDPNQIEVDGQRIAKEVLYSQRMTEQLHAFVPDPSDALQIAARAQHIQRWSIPRSDYPDGRKGYHRWRTALGAFHADVTGEILRDVGYDDAFVARVQSLLRKENRKRDPEMQQLEDVICLVFLRHYLEDFVRKHNYPEEKLIAIITKTWSKMSYAAQIAALQKLSFPASLQTVILKAVASAST